MSRLHRLVPFLGAAVFSFTTPLSSQTTAEVHAGVEFDFSTPGARSLALGGAFLALADDATAAYSNPAGLTALSRPEVSAEGRRWNTLSRFTDSGRFSGNPTGRGIDNVVGLHESVDNRTVNGPAFLSYVYPRRDWAVALYRHELADYQASFAAQGAFLQGFPGGPNPLPVRLRPSLNTFRLHITGYGVAAAFHAGSALSLGASVTLYDFNLAAQTRRFSLVNGGDITGVGGLLGPPLYTDANLFDSEILSGSGRRLGFNAGFLWRLTPAFTVGGVYRREPSFGFNASYLPAPRNALPKLSQQAHLKVPDVIGLGVAYKTSEVTTLVLDYVRVRYSQLTERFVDVFPEPPIDLRRFQVADGNELHLGLERDFLFRDLGLSLRGGMWTDPDHRVRYDGDQEAFRALFRPGRRVIHYTAGLGFFHSWFQIDGGFDYSSRVRTASLSTVVRF